MTVPRLPQGHVLSGRYSIQALLGDCGASATYRAVTAQGREVALRLLAPAVGQRADVIQLIEHATASTNTLPPDIVAHVIDAGYDQTTAAPFSARELVALTSLAEIGRPAQGGRALGPLPPDAVVKMIHALARALDAAHQRQLFHHAIKPSNVFLDPRAPHAPRLTDFGGGLGRAVVPTNEGYALAAPFLAPEQVRAGVPAAAQADVFAMALLAFHAMTGRSYWRSCAGPQIDLAGWQRELLAPRAEVSARGGELGTPIPAGLDTVFGRALAVDPADRFRSVGELATAIASVVGAGGGANTVALPSSAFLPPMPDAPRNGPQGGPAGNSPGAGGPPGAAGQAGGAQQGNPGAPAVGGYVAGRDFGPGGARQAPTELALPRVVAPRSKLLPIGLGIAALVLLSGAVGAYVVIRSRSAADAGPISVTAAETAKPATTPAPTGDPAPSGDPSAATSAAVAPAEPDAGPPTPVDVRLTCTPRCDRVTVEGGAMTVPASPPPRLAPGEYKVTASKAGYTAQEDTITVEAGKPFAKEYKLEAIAVAPRPAPGPAPGPGPTKVPSGTGAAKPCGKFLKRCN